MCPACGSTTKRIVVRHAQVVAEVTFASSLPAERCTQCEHVVMADGALAAFRRAVAVELARRGPTTAETFRWMRDVVPIASGELASILEVEPSVLRRWEQGGGNVDRMAWLIVGGLVLESVDANTSSCVRIAGAMPLAGRNVEISIERARVTVRSVLRMLLGPTTYPDHALANVLGLPLPDLRALLSSLERQGLVTRVAGGEQGDEWVVLAGRALDDLVARARRAGIAVDDPVPLLREVAC